MLSKFEMKIQWTTTKDVVDATIQGINLDNSKSNCHVFLGYRGIPETIQLSIWIHELFSSSSLNSTPSSPSILPRDGIFRPTQKVVLFDVFLNHSKPHAVQSHVLYSLI